MKISNIKYRVIVGLLLTMVMAGCSTQKAKFMNKLYHNTTAHYNVWWNGNESMKEARKQLETIAVDDYTRILPMYKLGTKEDAISVYPQLDRTLEKGAMGAQKHSIFVKGKEHVEYVKKSYLMMAYAHFYKQDYQAAIVNCRYVMSQYPGTDIADEAKILYARALTHDKQYAEAEMVLDQVDAAINSGKMSAGMADLLYPAMVECMLPQEKYKKAVDFLRLSIDNTSNRKFKARQYFIMAQIYHKLNKKATATKYYKKALSMRPEYVMEFNVRMNIASCYDISKGDYKGIEKFLNQMLDDKKNLEYIDQIYYAKGEMYLGAKNTQKACENFEKSIQVSTTNKSQKIKSALKLADVLYDIYQNYDEAQKYYDTAMAIMPKDYPNYDAIKERHYLLTSLVENTRVIALNDSLFMLADMNPADREKYIEKLIEKQKEADAKKREAEIEAAIRKEAQTVQKNTLKGDWYFYNESTVQKGKESFMRMWGTRALEDYWFLSQKPGMSLGMGANNLFADNEQEQTKDADSTADETKVDPTKANDKYSVDYYLKDLPKTQARRDTMHDDIARCLLNAGFIYDAGIENQEKALECFLRLVEDYQGSDYVLPAFYQLYKIYDKQGNTPSANYYKNMILRGFPDSDYANLIRDEDYYLEIAKRNKMAETEYEEIYRLFTDGYYRQVVSRASSAVQIYTKELSLIPKYKYWNAIALAKLSKTSEAIAMLEDIEKNHSKSEIVPLVREQIALLRNGFKSEAEDEKIDEKANAKKEKLDNHVANEKKQNDELPPESQLYRYRENLQHYVIFVLDDDKIRATEMQYAVADFNMAYYSAKALKANVMMFNDKQQLITVHRFENATEAMDYWNYINTKADALKKFDKKHYSSFVISVQNYQTFYNKKNIEAYRKFFEKYYIKTE